MNSVIHPISLGYNPNIDVCSTASQEPWWARGKVRVGKNPPSFAMYTRVNVPDTIGDPWRIIPGLLKSWTELTGAHYLYMSENEVGCYIEIWAHRSNLETIRKQLSFAFSA